MCFYVLHTSTVCYNINMIQLLTLLAVLIGFILGRVSTGKGPADIESIKKGAVKFKESVVREKCTFHSPSKKSMRDSLMDSLPEEGKL